MSSFSLVEVYKAPTKSHIEVALGSIFDLKQTQTTCFFFFLNKRGGKGCALSLPLAHTPGSLG